jgi:type I restriction enzyme S subunit
MKGVVPQLETAAKTDAHDDRKLVKKGDFAINSRSDRRGSCGIADRDGSVSLINTILAPRTEMNPDYYNWLFHSTSFADEFYRWGHGIVDDLWTTRWQEMKKIDVPVPSYDEQEKIAITLKNECSKVDALIANQEAQIEKLKAYKQSLITEVVTKGLNPNVPMKSSGVEAIGSIPHHWKIYRTKFVADAIFKGNGITKDEVVEDGDIQCIRYGEIYSKYDGSFEKTYSRTNESAITSPQYISSGDILFAGTGELVEEIGKNVVYTGKEPCLAGGDIIVLKHSQNPIFLNYALYCTSSQTQKSKGKAKLKVVHISASEIGNVIIALPPLAEQNAIAEYLDKKCEHISRLIEIKKKKIESLTLYKKSLIYEYVTGKKEVM